MQIFYEILIATILVLGGVFAFAGSYGLLKLHDTMQRLHGPTKTATFGVGSVLLASMLYFGLVQGKPSLHEVLIVLFLFISAPITANFIAKVKLHLDIAPSDLPRPGPGAEKWATHAPEENGPEA